MKKFFNFKNFKVLLLLIFLLCLYVFINAFTYVNTVSNDLQNSVFRLHVIANSDSKEDQNLKYIVRDNIINYMNDLCLNSSSKDETISIVSSHLEDFKTIANNTISENRFFI